MANDSSKQGVSCSLIKPSQAQQPEDFCRQSLHLFVHCYSIESYVRHVFCVDASGNEGQGPGKTGWDISQDFEFIFITSLLRVFAVIFFKPTGKKNLYCKEFNRIQTRTVDFVDCFWKVKNVKELVRCRWIVGSSNLNLLRNAVRCSSTGMREVRVDFSFDPAGQLDVHHVVCSYHLVNMENWKINHLVCWCLLMFPISNMLFFPVLQCFASLMFQPMFSFLNWRSAFSRMRSEGSRFIWGSGGEAVFAESCLYVRNRLRVRRKALHSGECTWSDPESMWSWVVSSQLYWRLQMRCLWEWSVASQLYWCLQRMCLWRWAVSPHLYWRLQRSCLWLWSVSPQLYWHLQWNCLCEGSVSLQLYWCLQRMCLREWPVAPQLYWCLQRRCLCECSVSSQLYWCLQRRCQWEWPASPQLYWILQRKCLCEWSVSLQLYWCLQRRCQWEWSVSSQCRRSYIGVCRGGVCESDLCRRSYIGVCRGGVCESDLCRRSYIGVCRGGVWESDLWRCSYIGVCRGGVCESDLWRRSDFGVRRGGVWESDLCRRIYIGVRRGGVCESDLCRRSYIGVCRGGVCESDLCRRSYFGVCKEEVSVRVICVK